MSNATIAHTREIARMARQSARQMARAAKFHVVTFDRHGYVIDDKDLPTWDAAVDYARQLRDSNPLVALSDIDEVN